MEVQALSPEVIQDTVSSSSSAPTKVLAEEIDRIFSRSTNVTTSVLNAKVLSRSDEWFAEAANLLNPGPVKQYPGVFISTGAKYDGWETRRHNPAEYDWAVIKLGCVATFDGVEIDTAYFTGNYGELASLDACYEPTGSQDSAIASSTCSKWETVLDPQPCGPSQRQAWKLSSSAPVTGKPFTHVRLRMYPDGGFARLRLYGKVVPPPVTSADAVEDLSSALNGGVATACSDQHYGVRSNLILPGRGVDMGDGWETARSRGKGHVDWVIVRLGLPGKSIDKIVIDTKDFKGNFPREVRVEGFAGNGKEGKEPEVDSKEWKSLLKGGDQPGRRDTETIYEGDKGLDIPVLEEGEVWTHVKMTMIPDGGVKRFRIFGRRA